MLTLPLRCFMRKHCARLISAIGLEALYCSLVTSSGNFSSNLTALFDFNNTKKFGKQLKADRHTRTTYLKIKCCSQSFVFKLVKGSIIKSNFVSRYHDFNFNSVFSLGKNVKKPFSFITSEDRRRLESGQLRYSRWPEKYIIKTDLKILLLQTKYCIYLIMKSHGIITSLKWTRETVAMKTIDKVSCNWLGYPGEKYIGSSLPLAIYSTMIFSKFIQSKAAKIFNTRT